MHGHCEYKLHELPRHILFLRALCISKKSMRCTAHRAKTAFRQCAASTTPHNVLRVEAPTQSHSQETDSQLFCGGCACRAPLALSSVQRLGEAALQARPSRLLLPQLPRLRVQPHPRTHASCRRWGCVCLKSAKIILPFFLARPTQWCSQYSVAVGMFHTCIHALSPRGLLSLHGASAACTVTSAGAAAQWQCQPALRHCITHD